MLGGRWIRLALASLGLAGALLAIACGGRGVDSGSSSGKLKVVATTVQITALAREVGGDLIDLHGVIPPGADPHSFEPTASDLTAIEDGGRDPAPRYRVWTTGWTAP